MYAKNKRYRRLTPTLSLFALDNRRSRDGSMLDFILRIGVFFAIA